MIFFPEFLHLFWTAAWTYFALVLIVDLSLNSVPEEKKIPVMRNIYKKPLLFFGLITAV